MVIHQITEIMEMLLVRMKMVVKTAHSYDGDDSYQGDVSMEHLITQHPTRWSEYSTMLHIVESLDKELLLVLRVYLWMEDKTMTIKEL